jgi:hypothetical protein
MPSLHELEQKFEQKKQELAAASAAWDNLPANATDQQVTAARSALNTAIDECDTAEQNRDQEHALQTARGQFQRTPLEHASRRRLDIRVSEPDMYQRTSPTGFLRDLYLSQVKNDVGATARITAHQQYEVSKMTEERAIATSTLGGVIPPHYLVSMYAKASRNGRVFADQVNHPEGGLPDEGMSLIVPRITTASAAGIQASESSTLTTQDVAETDLTVNVRTIGGYLPVSRQTLERASYSEPILFEDLIARYNAALDSGCLTGDGNSGAIKGVFHTSGTVAISANSDGTLTKLWNTLANAQEQILAKWGGLGLQPDKCFLHPRRWAAISTYLDDSHRPVFGINGQDYFNVLATGEPNYGYVGRMQGLDVYVDSNMPVNLDTNTNRDAIIVTCSNVVHLWERNEDPITLAFEQQNGNALQTQLIVYGYVAFTAERYPDATCIIDDFPAPTF